MLFERFLHFQHFFFFFSFIVPSFFVFILLSIHEHDSVSRYLGFYFVV